MTQHTPSQRAQLTRLPWAQEGLLQLQQVQLQVTVVIQHLMIKLPLEAVAVVVNNRAGHPVVLAAAVDTTQAVPITVEVEQLVKVMRAEETAPNLVAVAVALAAVVAVALDKLLVTFNGLLVLKFYIH